MSLSDFSPRRKIPVFAAQGITAFELEDPDAFMLASGPPGWAYEPY